jgi:hypothetical protein
VAAGAAALGAVAAMTVGSPDLLTVSIGGAPGDGHDPEAEAADRRRDPQSICGESALDSAGTRMLRERLLF